ncbi:hypothetical protein QLQ12_12655 [Actinoplanes sp. NEAU-A12]|uniref:Uncharacterized protein n=1 Tax=Actinoplanes sandaracinus TaxID=3045177 RepID=A0ABT6WIA3_9ACTN|nr:hypothetical protein [Actinoplanes sandaracinus]MDI6099445.1 hypothetical protein [Actinoplanes sandaracinus]
MGDAWTTMRRGWAAAVAALAALALTGCQPSDAARRRFLPGIAKIGDSYQVFAPVCPGEKMVEIRVYREKSARDESLDPDVWWQAAGPRSADGPGEVVVLGEDGPFTDIAVPAGGDPSTPDLPATFSVLMTFTDLLGNGGSGGFEPVPAGIPQYPAGTDPRQVRYLTRQEGGLVSPEELRSGSDCRTRRGTIPAAPTAAPGQQPPGSFRPGAAERVQRATLGPGAGGRLPSAERDPRYMEDVASHVCGNGPRSGALGTAFGRERLWRDEGVEVRQFTGAYGTITAAEAIGQVDGVLRG